MILVFLLLGFIILLALIAYILLLSSIKVKVTKLHILKSDNEFELKLISKLGLYLFGKIRLLELTIDDNRLKKMYRSGKINIQKLKDNSKLNKDTLKLLRKVNFIIEEFHLQGYIGTESAGVTALISGMINALIPILISKRINEYQKEKYHYQLDTIYINQNIVNLDFNCIISIKMVHIINVIYILLRKGSVKKNERTSNRRAYAYSHE